MGVVWRMEDRVRRPGVVKELWDDSLPGDRCARGALPGERRLREASVKGGRSGGGLLMDTLSGEGWKGPRMICGVSKDATEG